MAEFPPPLRFDCESRESTRACLLALFGCEAATLDDFLTDTTLDDEYQRGAWELPPFDEFVYERACRRLGIPQMPTELCWFHGTRVPAGTTFTEGILPLPQALARLKANILATLNDKADRQEVRSALERENGLTFHLQNKLTGGTEYGPFAMFVREMALDARATSQHAYVDMPEIIEDLCAEVQASCGRDLIPLFEQAWLPAVVKFVTPAFSPEFHKIGRAHV